MLGVKAVRQPLFPAQEADLDLAQGVEADPDGTELVVRGEGLEIGDRGGRAAGGHVGVVLLHEGVNEHDIARLGEELAEQASRERRRCTGSALVVDRVFDEDEVAVAGEGVARGAKMARSLPVAPMAAFSTIRRTCGNVAENQASTGSGQRAPVF